MPSYRVNRSTVSLDHFDVVGNDGGEAGFIGHVGLASTTDSQDVARIAVLDMGPPLHGHGSGHHIRGDVIGSAVLTDDEAQKIRTFVDRHANEHLLFSQFSVSQLLKLAPQMYCVVPHTSPLYEDNGRYARTRFSCAGFVLETYKSARVKLLNLDGLPLVDMGVVAAAYPQTRLIERGIINAEGLGLGGDGPWRVLLCGYLFHSLNREADAIRDEAYTPSITDRHFH